MTDIHTNEAQEADGKKLEVYGEAKEGAVAETRAAIDNYPAHLKGNYDERLKALKQLKKTALLYENPDDVDDVAIEVRGIKESLEAIINRQEPEYTDMIGGYKGWSDEQISDYLKEVEGILEEIGKYYQGIAWMSEHDWDEPY